MLVLKLERCKAKFPRTKRTRGRNLWRIAYLIDLRQLRDLWSMQDTQGQTDHLQILASSGGGDVTRFGADIVDDRLLQPRNQKMRAFAHDSIFDSRKPIEYDCTSASFDVVNRLLSDISQGDRDEEFAHPSERVCHRDKLGEMTTDADKERPLEQSLDKFSSTWWNEVGYFRAKAQEKISVSN